jgi:hypothetical protein
MTILEIFFLSLIALGALWVIITLTGPHAVYMFLMENKEWRTWRFIRKNLDKFVFDEKKSISSSIRFVWDDYKIIVWNDMYGEKPHASVHNKNRCVCSPFWYHESKRLAEKLLKINNISCHDYNS